MIDRPISIGDFYPPRPAGIEDFYPNGLMPVVAHHDQRLAPEIVGGMISLIERLKDGKEAQLQLLIIMKFCHLTLETYGVVGLPKLFNGKV